MRTAARLQSNLGGGTLAEEGDHLGTTEIDPQHRLAGLVDGVQGENGFGRIDANALNLGHGRLRSWLLTTQYWHWMPWGRPPQHLSMPRRGSKCKLGYHRVFNLILWVLYTGMQWKCMPVPRAADGIALIHYTTIYKVFAKWADDGSLDQAFVASVRHLAEQHQLDLNILHDDGTNTVAKKGGDGIGYSGHKHQKEDKIIAIVDNNGFVVAPLPVAPVNETDTVLLPEGLNTP